MVAERLAFSRRERWRYLSKYHRSRARSVRLECRVRRHGLYLSVQEVVAEIRIILGNYSRAAVQPSGIFT
jgi:hypothetical protein